MLNCKQVNIALEPVGLIQQQWAVRGSSPASVCLCLTLHSINWHGTWLVSEEGISGKSAQNVTYYNVYTCSQ
jgi:hypothetical protein